MKIRNYLDQLTLEYTQLCQRNDGSIYGIASGKQCRKGKPISYHPNLAKLEKKQELKQVRVSNKDKVSNIVAKAKDIGLSNKDIRYIKEEIKVELDTKEVQGKEAFKLFAKKSNEIAEGRNAKKVLEKANSGNYSDYVEVAKKNHKKELDQVDQLQAEVIEHKKKMIAPGISLEERRRNLEEAKNKENQIRRNLAKIRTDLLERNNSYTAEIQADILLSDSANNSLPRSRKFYEEEFTKLYQIVQNKVDTLRKIEYTDDRAYAYPGVINVGKKEDEDMAKGSLWHEFGHHVEFSNPGLKDAADSWLLSRITGEIKSLNELTNSDQYGPDDKAYVGNFGLGQYVSIIYSDGSTEVISMGLQRFVNEKAMANFYSLDQEHFLLILGMLDSL